MSSVIVNNLIVENVENCPNCKKTEHIIVSGRVQSIRIQCKRCGLNQGKVFTYNIRKTREEDLILKSLKNGFSLWNKQTIPLSGKIKHLLPHVRELTTSELASIREEKEKNKQIKKIRKYRRAIKPNE